MDDRGNYEDRHTPETPNRTHNVDAQLKSIVERIERLEEEKASTAQDIKEVYTEAKGSGLDSRILRRIISMRKLDPNEMHERETITETYMKALGMI